MWYFVLFFTLASSTFTTYLFAYQILWYKLGELFELTSSNGVGSLLAQPTNWNIRLASTDTAGLKDTFLRRLRSQYAISSHSLKRLVRILFSLSMTLYVLTIEIVLVQIVSAPSSANIWCLRTVTNLWSGLISPTLTIILLFLQPFCVLGFLFEKFFGRNLSVGKLISLDICVLILSFGLLRTLSFGPFSQASNALNRLSIAGVGLMSVLSGIAAMSTVYYISLFFYYQFRYGHRRPILPLQSLIDSGGIEISGIWAGKGQIEQTLEFYSTLAEENIRTLNNLKPYNLGSSFNSLHEREILLERISRYERNIDRLKDLLRRPSVTRIDQKYFSLVYLLYCLYNMGLTFFVRIPTIIKYHHLEGDNSAFAELVARTDPLAVTLANVLDAIFFHFSHQHDLNSLTREISLLISLSLFVLSLSTAHRTISLMQTLLPVKLRILDMLEAEEAEILPRYEGVAYPRNTRPPSMIKNLVVSEIVGIYIMAAVVMIRSNLPPDISEKLINMLGERFYLGNVEIEKWFCQIYASSCILTLCVVKLISFRRHDLLLPPYRRRHKPGNYL